MYHPNRFDYLDAPDLPETDEPTCTNCWERERVPSLHHTFCQACLDEIADGEADAQEARLEYHPSA